MIGLVGSGAMGSALGAGWVAAGERVITFLDGRSGRTRDLTERAGVEPAGSLHDVVGADVVVSVVPPGAAVEVARSIGDTARQVGSAPLVVDLNAIAPTTVEQVIDALGGLDLVDGSISGGPPSAQRATRVYLCGAAAGRVPANPWLDVVLLGSQLGTASALKMCTASMYKGTRALVLQAMLTARRHGVLEQFLADTARQWPDEVPEWHVDIALAATKSARYVDEMLEIARTQADAGQSAELFEGMAAVYRRVAGTELGARAPEWVDGSQSVADVLDELGTDDEHPDHGLR